MTFWLGTLGFFAMMYVGTKADDWAYAINRKRANVISWAIMLGWGFGCALLMASSGLTWNKAGGGCYIEWDGRSNPEVCN